MIINPTGWAGTVYLLFPVRTPRPRAMEELAPDLTKCVLGIARPRRSFLFSSFSIPTISPESLDLGFLGYHWRRAKGKVTLGDIPGLHGHARLLPQSLGAPGLPCSSSSPSDLPVSRSGCQVDLGLDPGLPRPSPAPEGADPWEPEHFSNPEKPWQGPESNPPSASPHVLSCSLFPGPSCFSHPEATVSDLASTPCHS